MNTERCQFWSIFDDVHPADSGSRISSYRRPPATGGGSAMKRKFRHAIVGVLVTVGLAGLGWRVSADPAQSSSGLPQAEVQTPVSTEDADGALRKEPVSELLDWNQIFYETLIATNTANSSSQRLGAIVHTAIFDAYNGIEQRYTPILVRDRAPKGSSRRGSIIAAAYTTLAGLFPSQTNSLQDRYAAALAALSDDEEDG